MNSQKLTGVQPAVENGKDAGEPAPQDLSSKVEQTKGQYVS